MTPPEQKLIESRTLEIGQEIFRDSKLSFLARGFWYTKVMELATSDPRVKTQLFRFVDVLPVLNTLAQKKAHLIEYLSPPSHARRWPFALQLISLLVKVPLLDRVLVWVADIQVRQMANNFIIGRDVATALPRIQERRRDKIGFTLDILGEGVFSDEDADYYFQKYKSLIEGLGAEARSWKRVSPTDESDLGPIPPVNISIKVSALDCRMDSMAFDASLDRLVNRLHPLLEIAVKNEVFINFDMEQFALKDLTQALFRRLLLLPKFRTYRFFGIVVQAYLRSAHEDIKDWIAFSRERGTPFSIRLVKGAYWDYEVIVASQNGWPIPVWEKKPESDAHYEYCTRLMLDAYPAIELALGSHNIRSISHAMAYAEAIRLPRNAFEIQMLYGMADPFKTALVKKGMRVREYTPAGEMLPGLSYLVRRLLENSANDSFLKQSFMDKTGIRQLLQKPDMKLVE